MSDSLPKLVPGGLKPLQVTRNRRSKSNGGPANVELATDSEVERRKSADSRTHSRRESGAVDGVNVVQTTGARVSPSSPVHRAGYHDAIDDEPSNVGIESSMSAAVSPRHVVSPHSGSGHQHTDRPRPGLLARLNFFRAPAQIEPFSPGTTSKPTAGSVWPSAIHTDFKLVPAKDDGKESKPTSPAMLMLQQKQRCCGFHSGRRMFGMLIAVFGWFQVGGDDGLLANHGPTRSSDCADCNPYRGPRNNRHESAARWTGTG